jgi:hypothetical protein
MNTYELKINTKIRAIDENMVIIHYIECEENNLKEQLFQISTKGILVEIEDFKRYISPYTIDTIDVKAIERVQSLLDVQDVIKQVLIKE